MKSVEAQLEVIKRGVVDIVSETELIQKLKKSFEKNTPLTIKLVIDPTGADIHLGHTVVLNKLRQFQELGHKIVLIIGDYTAMIGDPSGRLAERPQLDRETILKNVENFKQQAMKILDGDKMETVYNGAWFGKMEFMDVIKMISKFTLAQMLEHDYFDKRFKEGTAISLHEMIYPIMQGYDSVMIKADIELGGTDQRFNVIVGRYLQRESGQDSQVGLFLPVLLGTDGKNKMSKSLKNYIGVNDAPADMFGKIMSIPDELMPQYYELLTQVPLKEINEMPEEIKSGKVHPMQLKKNLADIIVGKFHSDAEAKQARAAFENVFSKGEIPTDIMEYKVPTGKINISTLMVAAGLATSNSEARRLITQGGVSINDEKISDFKKELEINGEVILKVGKRKFLKITR